MKPPHHGKKSNIPSYFNILTSMPWDELKSSYVNSKLTFIFENSEAKPKEKEEEKQGEGEEETLIHHPSSTSTHFKN